MLFQDLGARQVVADFSGGTLSSEGGVLFLRQADQNLGLTLALARCFVDRRDGRYVDHGLEELLAQRIYAQSLGWEDVNDHQRLRLDPLLEAYAGGDLLTKGNIVRASGKISAGDAIKKLLLGALAPLLSAACHP